MQSPTGGSDQGAVRREWLRALAKRRNAEPGRLWGSLWASIWAAIRCVTPFCHSSCYARIGVPYGLTAQMLAEYGFIYEGISM